MYPYHHHWHRGPSRILWFFIGAASATFWIKRKDMHNEGHFSRCFRAPIQQPPPASAPAWSARDIPGAINNIPPAEPVPWALGHQKSASSREEERILELTRQAGDAMTEFSEATLDTVLSTVEALKAKLAEHRAEREKQKKILEKQIDEERRNPPRLV